MTYELEYNHTTRQWHAMCTDTKRTIEQGTDRAAVINAVEKLGYVWEQ
ncbi:MAG: hypothetical protein ACXW1D_00310 [Halobacteriota archaeon]